MKRKLAILFSMMAFILPSIFLLSACGKEDPKITGISVDLSESNEYVLTDGDIIVTYGQQLIFDKDDFVVSTKWDDGTTKKVENEYYTLTSTLPATGITPAGSYTITFSYENVEDVVIDIIVHQADKEVGEVQWNHDGSVPFVYDKNTEVTMEIINVPEGISVQYTGTPSAKTVGRYTTTAHFTADDPNYVAVPPTTTIEWEITKANIVVPTVTLKNYTYAEDTNRTAEINEQLPEDVEVSYSGDTSATNAGTYNVTVSFTYTGDDASNYNAISSQQKQWTIEKAEWTEVGTVELVQDEFTYNGADQSVQVNSSKLDSRVEVYELTGSTNKNADDYTATAKLRVIGNDNYYIDNVNLNWNIGKKELTVTPNAVNITFGDSFDNSQGYNITGFVGGEDESIVEGTLTCVATKYSAGNDAGTYEITLDGELTAENYSLKYNKGTLTVAEKGVSVAGLTWNYENPFTYNGESQNIELSSLPTGVQAVYTYKLNNVVADTINAGTYNATVELTAKKNYTLTDTFATTTKEFVINKKDVTINVNNNSVYYSQEAENNGFEVVGLVEGENKNVFTGAVYGFGDYATTSNAGLTFDITVTGLQAQNYNVKTNNKGVLTVEALPVDLSQVSCVWDYENPFTYSAGSQKIELSSVPTGLVANYSYTLKGETTEIDPTDAGTYVATVTFTALNDNYVTTGTLTNNIKEFVINKAKVTVKANDAQITFGEDASNNGFEVVSGLLGEDTKAVFTGDSYAYGTFTTTSNVGTYDITVSGLVADNYEVETYQAGTLTVVALGVSVEGYSYVWDYENPLTYNKGIQGIVLSSTAPTGLQTTYTYTVQGGTEETNPINAGTYTATATFVPVNSNYVVEGTHTNNTQEFVISPATINITSLEWDIDNDYEFVYDGETSFEPTITNEIENISFTYKYFDHEDLSNPLDEVVNAGEYRVVATLNYDAENYRLLTSSSVELYKDYTVNSAPLCVIEDLAWSVGETTSGEANSIKEYYVNYDYTGEAYNEMAVNGLTDKLQVKFYNDEDDSQIETLSFTDARDYRIYAVITLKDEYANNYIISNQFGTGGVTEVRLYLNIQIVDIPEIASLSAQVYSFDSNNSSWEVIAGDTCNLTNSILTGIKATDDEGVDYTDVRLYADEAKTELINLTNLNNVPNTIYYEIFDNDENLLKEDSFAINYTFIDNNENNISPNAELSITTTESEFSVQFTNNNSDLTVNSVLKVSGSDEFVSSINLENVTTGTYKLEITLNSTTYHFETPFSIINSISVADAIAPETVEPQLTFTSADETDTIVMLVNTDNNSITIDGCNASDYIELKGKIESGEYTVDFPIVDGYVIADTELVEVAGIAYLKLTITPEIQTFALNEDSDTYILIRINLEGKIDSDVNATITYNNAMGTIEIDEDNKTIQMNHYDSLYLELSNEYANFEVRTSSDEIFTSDIGSGYLLDFQAGTYTLKIYSTDGSEISTYTITVTDFGRPAAFFTYDETVYALWYDMDTDVYTGDFEFNLSNSCVNLYLPTNAVNDDATTITLSNLYVAVFRSTILDNVSNTSLGSLSTFMTVTLTLGDLNGVKYASFVVDDGDSPLTFNIYFSEKSSDDVEEDPKFVEILSVTLSDGRKLIYGENMTDYSTVSDFKISATGSELSPVMNFETYIGTSATVTAVNSMGCIVTDMVANTPITDFSLLQAKTEGVEVPYYQFSFVFDAGEDGMGTFVIILYKADYNYPANLTLGENSYEFEMQYDENMRWLNAGDFGLGVNDYNFKTQISMASLTGFELDSNFNGTGYLIVTLDKAYEDDSYIFATEENANFYQNNSVTIAELLLLEGVYKATEGNLTLIIPITFTNGVAKIAISYEGFVGYTGEGEKDMDAPSFFTLTFTINEAGSENPPQDVVIQDSENVDFADDSFTFTIKGEEVNSTTDLIEKDEQDRVFYVRTSLNRENLTWQDKPYADNFAWNSSNGHILMAYYWDSDANKYALEAFEINKIFYGINGKYGESLMLEVFTSEGLRNYTIMIVFADSAIQPESLPTNDTFSFKVGEEEVGGGVEDWNNDGKRYVIYLQNTNYADISQNLELFDEYGRIAVDNFVLTSEGAQGDANYYYALVEEVDQQNETSTTVPYSTANKYFTIADYTEYGKVISIPVGHGSQEIYEIIVVFTDSQPETISQGPADSITAIVNSNSYITTNPGDYGTDTRIGWIEDGMDELSYYLTKVLVTELPANNMLNIHSLNISAQGYDTIVVQGVSADETVFEFVGNSNDVLCANGATPYGYGTMLLVTMTDSTEVNPSKNFYIFITFEVVENGGNEGELPEDGTYYPFSITLLGQTLTSTVIVDSSAMPPVEYEVFVPRYINNDTTALLEGCITVNELTSTDITFDFAVLNMDIMNASNGSPKMSVGGTPIELSQENTATGVNATLTRVDETNVYQLEIVYNDAVTIVVYVSVGEVK